MGCRVVQGARKGGFALLDKRVLRVLSMTVVQLALRFMHCEFSSQLHRILANKYSPDRMSHKAKGCRLERGE